MNLSQKKLFIYYGGDRILNKNKDIFWIIDPIDGTTNFYTGYLILLFL